MKRFSYEIALTFQPKKDFTAFWFSATITHCIIEI